MRVIRMTPTRLHAWTVAAAVALSLGLFAPPSRAAEKEASKAPEAAKVGDAAPEFSLKDQNGKPVKLSDFKDKIVVIHWFNEDCPFIQRHYDEMKTFTKLDDKYRDKGVVQLAISSTGASTAADNKKWVEAHAMKFPILNDPDKAVALAYGAKTTPHCFVIDKAGKIAYRGAIDNDPNGSKADRVNYVEKALDELLAGKPVSEPETKSYGCSVH